MSKKHIPMPDAALAIQAAVTKTASFNGDWLDLGEGYSPGGLGVLAAAVVEVSALDTSDTDETYVFKLQQAALDEEAGEPDTDTIEDIGVGVAVEETGVAVVKGVITERFVRLVLTAGGTTPSITYSARLGK